MILEQVVLIVRVRQDWKPLPHRLHLDIHGEETPVDDKRGAAIEDVHP